MQAIWHNQRGTACCKPTAQEQENKEKDGVEYSEEKYIGELLYEEN